MSFSKKRLTPIWVDCIWRPKANIHAPQCKRRFEAETPKQVCCWQHTIAWRYLRAEEKEALRNAAEVVSA